MVCEEETVGRYASQQSWHFNLNQILLVKFVIITRELPNYIIESWSYNLKTPRFIEISILKTSKVVKGNDVVIYAEQARFRL